MIDLCKLWIPKICGRALWGSTDASDLHAENMITMTVQTNGHVTGLGAALVAKHATIAQVWKSEWQTMLQAGDLTCPFDDNDSGLYSLCNAKDVLRTNTFGHPRAHLALFWLQCKLLL